MKHFFKIVLIAIVLLNIIDGDLKNPSIFDIVKFVLLAIAIALSFRSNKQG